MKIQYLVLSIFVGIVALYGTEYFWHVTVNDINWYVYPTKILICFFDLLIAVNLFAAFCILGESDKDKSDDEHFE